MRPVRDACRPRPEVLEGELDDAIFAADFGHVVDGSGPDVYKQPDIFFRNTFPTEALKRVVGSVFGRLAKPDDSGGVVRLSTGFGGGKTHALIALWHLANNVAKPGLGTELLPAAGRPKSVAVAGVDGGKLGTLTCGTHGSLITHSLWGELAYQLGGETAYATMKALDQPETTPSAAELRAVLPADRPVLILLDELVMYMAKLSPQGQGALLAFIGALMSEITSRRQAVLVITDPAGQTAFVQETTALAQKLNEFVARQASDYDPIGNEAPQVIVRRLFEAVDETAAQVASAEYYQAYSRLNSERPDLVPVGVATIEYAQRIVQCYPFHPRLLETAQNRLGAMQDFQKSRGTLRLFARVLQDLWQRQSNVGLVQAGDVNWANDRIRADLLQRLNRGNLQAATDADVLDHARQLDKELATDIHGRVASALLLESLPATPTATMDRAELTLATFRPSDVGHEASEAVDRLLSVCWHLYKDDTGRRFQFRYQPNANKMIEERAQSIPWPDARQAVLAVAQAYFGGHTFQLVSYPTSARAVPDSAKLKLVLTDSEQLARAICDYEDDSDPDALKPRAFRNAIFAVAPSPDALNAAVAGSRRLKAAEDLAKEHQPHTPLREQLDGLLLNLRKRSRIQTIRAFNRIVLPGKRRTLPLDERFLVSEDSPLENVSGQGKLAEFLAEKRLIYQANDSIDPDLLVQRLLPGATPSLDYQGAFSARAVHERALSSDDLRLLPNDNPVRNAIVKAVEQGKLVLRLADGSAYDQDGCVSGLAGNRKRNAQQKPAVFALDDSVLLAPPDAPCVADWLKVDELSQVKGPLLAAADVAQAKSCSLDDVLTAIARGQLDTVYQNGQQWVVDNHRLEAWVPRPTEQNTFYSWEDAIAAAARRRLQSVELKATDIQAAKQLYSIALPLSAHSLRLSVSLSGQASEGGQVNFSVEGLKHNHPLKPLDVAATMLHSLHQAVSFEATLHLDFGEAGQTDCQAKLQQAREAAGGSVAITVQFHPSHEEN